LEEETDRRAAGLSVSVVGRTHTSLTHKYVVASPFIGNAHAITVMANGRMQQARLVATRGYCIVIRVVCKCRLSVTYCKKVKRSKEGSGPGIRISTSSSPFGICGMVHSHGSQPCSEKASAPGRCATARSDIREQSPWSVLPLKLRMKRRGPERQRLQVQRRRWEKPKPARAQHLRCRLQQAPHEFPPPT
jgi:hypothetical protein